MLASIRKFSKSFLAKIFIALIALPFILWGMGDVFTSGKQNVLVEINDDKINSKDFVSYLQKINLSPEQVSSLGESRIFDDILTNYISEKIISIETKKKGFALSDESLMKILVNDKAFQKEKKFSRTKYEKFLLKSRFTAPTYEKYIKNAELKGQLLNYYSGGIKLPKFLINDLYKKENKIIEIEYLDLNKIYSKNILKEEDINKFYEDNKSLFNERFISFRYLELLPKYLTDKKTFDEDYFKKLDELENEIIDGKTFDAIITGNEKFVKKINLVNSRKISKDGKEIEEINSKLFSKIFIIKEKNTPQFINLDDKYYVVEIIEDKNLNLTLNDKSLKDTIIAQLKIRYKIDQNKILLEKINNKKLNNIEIAKLSQDNNVPLTKVKINGINDTINFDKDLVKKIYSQNSNEIFVLSDGFLRKNFLVKILKNTDPQINPNSEDYKKYIEKANTEYISKIYKSYDKYINENYEIDLNEKVVERLKNSF